MVLLMIFLLIISQLTIQFVIVRRHIINFHIIRLLIICMRMSFLGQQRAAGCCLGLHSRGMMLIRLPSWRLTLSRSRIL